MTITSCPRTLVPFWIQVQRIKTVHLPSQQGRFVEPRLEPTRRYVVSLKNYKHGKSHLARAERMQQRREMGFWSQWDS